MGRKRKYHTEKERRDAQRKWQMEHYKRNSDKIKAKARERYREKKEVNFMIKKFKIYMVNLILNNRL